VVILSFDGPRENSSTTFELFPLDGHLSFSSLLKAYFISYFEFGSITSTSKVVMDGAPMVITTMWGLVKCKFQAAL